MLIRAPNGGKIIRSDHLNIGSLQLFSNGTGQLYAQRPDGTRIFRHVLRGYDLQKPLALFMRGKTGATFENGRTQFTIIPELLNQTDEYQFLSIIPPGIERPPIQISASSIGIGPVNINDVYEQGIDNGIPLTNIENLTNIGSILPCYSPPVPCNCTTNLPPVIQAPPLYQAASTHQQFLNGHAEISPAFAGTAIASSTCPEPPLITYTDAYDVNSFERTWRATDACGQMTTAKQIIATENNSHRRLVMPPAIEVHSLCDPAFTPGPGTFPKIFDPTCPSANVVANYVDAPLATGYTGQPFVRRTWTVTDSCSAFPLTGSQDIFINDTEAPELVLPADIILDCSADLSPTNTGGHATVIDQCGDQIVIDFNDVVIDPGCPGLIERIWTATDSSGNTDTAIQRIALDGNTGLVLHVPPDYMTPDCLEPGISTHLAGMATATTDCGTIVSLTFSDSQPFEVRGMIRRTWRAEDSCGRVDLAYQHIVSHDTTPPAFTSVPADINAPHCRPLSIDLTGEPTATDNCAVQVTFQDRERYAPPNFPRVIQRVWTATDTAGNTDQAEQLIYPDAFNLRYYPPDFTLHCNSTNVSPAVSGEPFTFQACHGTGNPTVDPPIGSHIYLDIVVSNTPTRTVIRRNWIHPISRFFGHAQIITIIHDSLVLIPPPDLHITNCQTNGPTPETTGTPTVQNSCGDAVFSYTDNTTPFTGGAHIERNWVLNAGQLNETAATQMITITFSPDTTPPSITLPEDFFIFDQTHDTEVLASGGGYGSTTVLITNKVAVTPASESPFISTNVASAVDDCSPETWNTFVDRPVGRERTFDITRTWLSADASGNITTEQQHIVIAPTERAPVTRPPTAFVTSTNDLSPAVTGAPLIFTDCPGAATVNFTDTPGPCSRIIERQWNVTTCMGNTDFTQQIVLPQSFFPRPVITVPPSLRIPCGSDFSTNTLGVATAMDADGNPATVAIESEQISGSTCPRLITRRWVATDACGQTSGADQHIIESDTDAMVLIPPSTGLSDCGTDQSPATTGLPIVYSSNCPDAPVITYSDQIQSYHSEVQVVLRTFTATNSCGQIAQGDQTLLRRTITFRNRPTIILPPDIHLPCNSEINTNVTGAATATAPCRGIGSINFTDDMPLGTDCPTRIYRTFRAETDGAIFGSFQERTQVIHLGGANVFPPELPDNPAFYQEPGIVFSSLPLIDNERAKATGIWSFWTLIERLAAPADPQTIPAGLAEHLGNQPNRKWLSGPRTQLDSRIGHQPLEGQGPSREPNHLRCPMADETRERTLPSARDS